MLDTKWGYTTDHYFNRKWEAIADYLCDNGFNFCENCGELTHDDEMRHGYCHNGYESWGEPIYSECETCADAEIARLNREYGLGGRRA